MNIIITGMSGFVGQNLANYLAVHGHNVQGMSLRTESWSLPKNADAVIHLAGKAHDTSDTSEAESYFKINRDLTKTLFDQFLTANIRDFFYFSSVKAVTDSVEGILDESYKAQPHTPYGKSKLEAEKYLLSQPLPEYKRLFIIRPCMIHGPGNKGNLNLLYQIVQKGIPWPLASFQNHRSFLSIDNLNFLILRMLEANVSPGTYNFADDSSLATNDVVKIMAAAACKKVKLWSVNKGLIAGLAKIGDMLKLPLTSERLRKLTENYIVSNMKIKKELGIDRLPVSTEDGLVKTLKSFQK